MRIELKRILQAGWDQHACRFQQVVHHFVHARCSTIFAEIFFVRHCGAQCGHIRTLQIKNLDSVFARPLTLQRNNKNGPSDMIRCLEVRVSYSWLYKSACEISPVSILQVPPFACPTKDLHLHKYLFYICMHTKKLFSNIFMPHLLPLISPRGARLLHRLRHHAGQNFGNPLTKLRCVAPAGSYDEPSEGWGLINGSCNFD